MRDILKYSAATHIGLVRGNNEDCYAILDHEGSWPFLFALSDGMGGHRRGELASRIAVDYVSERFVIDLLEEKTTDQQEKLLTDIMQKANVKVYLGSFESEDNKGMGTTLTMALFYEEHVWLSHIGDCRMYLYRSGELTQLTIDHTLVQEMVDAGTLSPNETSRHPKRNVLTQALGVPEYLKPDVIRIDLDRNDRLLLCSDGLYGLVEAEEIRNVMKKHKDPDSVVARLIQLALDHGGEDNVTVLAINA